MTKKTVSIKISGKTIQAQEGETLINAIWNAGIAESIKAGCTGGVCGACTVTLRYSDGRQGGTELACMKTVLEGMEVFPCPVDADVSMEPVANPDVLALQSVFPTFNRCTKCDSCTKACPMSIPVMESVLRMQKGEFLQVAEDFMTCIHCGLCRFVCEDRVKPHNMGLWVRRSIGMSREVTIANSESEEVWKYLLVKDRELRLERARQFRETGEIQS